LFRHNQGECFAGGQSERTAPQAGDERDAGQFAKRDAGGGMASPTLFFSATSGSTRGPAIFPSLGSPGSDRRRSGIPDPARDDGHRG